MRSDLSRESRGGMPDAGGLAEVVRIQVSVVDTVSVSLHTQDRGVHRWTTVQNKTSNPAPRVWSGVLY